MVSMIKVIIMNARGIYFECNVIDLYPLYKYSSMIFTSKIIEEEEGKSECWVIIPQETNITLKIYIQFPSCHGYSDKGYNNNPKI